MNSEEREIQRTIWREQELDEIEASKANMAKEHGLARDAKFELAWKIAMGYHESYGGDVEQIFGEMTELLK